VNLRNIVITGADDDSLDWDAGWQGGIQSAIVIQREGGGDNAIEGSSGSQNNDRLPRTLANVANFTFVTRNNAGAQAILLNQGSDANLVNGVVTGKPICLDIDNNATVAAQPTFNSIFFTCPTAFRDLPDGTDTVTAAQIAALFNAGQNNVANGMISLVDRFINGPNENAVAASNPITITGSSFFRNLTYIGAVQNAADNTFRGWTCSLYANGPAC
jgi:hypothetical protein